MRRRNLGLRIVIGVALVGFAIEDGRADDNTKRRSNPQQIEINEMKPRPQQMAQFMALPDGPIVLVNLLKFKPKGGQAEYQKYGLKIQPLLKKIGAKMLFVGNGKMCFIGKGDWDRIALVEYPSKMALIKMAMTPEYRAAHKHREAGLQGQINYVVVRDKQFELFFGGGATKGLPTLLGLDRSKSENDVTKPSEVAKGNTGSQQPPIYRGAPYGEVVLMRWNGLMLEGEVWASAGLNDDPSKSWKSLDSKAIRSEKGAFAVVMNGPRYFLANSASGPVASGKCRKFGDLKTRHVATITVNPLVNGIPYSEHRVRRNSRFVYDKGEEIYELKSPDGTIYTMISMSQIVDPKLRFSQLPNLGDRLKLPKGWTFQPRKLDRELVLTANSQAVVLQDELRNTYQRR